jgi:rhomboid protease GluP
MIREKLNSYFQDRGLSKVDLHTPQMELYYKSEEKSASLVWIISDEARLGMNREAYLRYHKKIMDTFTGRGFLFVNILSLFLTAECKAAATLAEGTPFWIADEKYGRLVVYENQLEDFLGSRLAIEQMLSFMKREQVKQEEENRRKREDQERYYEYIKGVKEGRAGNSARSTRKTRGVNRKISYVTLGLVAVNFIIYMLTTLLGGLFGTSELSDLGAVNWWDVIENHEYYRLITCMFLHANGQHLIGNMIVLYAAGDLLESQIGHLKYAIVYFGGGLLASIGSTYYYYLSNQYVESVGASGAIFGIVGALIVYMIVNKNAVRQLDPARIMIFVLYMLYTLYSGFTSSTTDGAAHLAGLIGGSLVYLAVYSFSKDEK